MIINKICFTVLVIALTLLNSDLAYANPNVSSLTFSQHSFEQIKKQHLGKRWLMLLWSVDCPPCFKELALVQKLSEKKPNIAVVIINADDHEDATEEREKVIRDFKLSQLPNFHFSDSSATQNRYIIDRTWYGELPRSYFIDKSGKFHGRSGLVSEQLLKKWLIEQ